MPDPQLRVYPATNSCARRAVKTDVYVGGLTLRDALPYLEDGDLLLFRKWGLIAVAGRGEHSHAAKFARCEGDDSCLEVREFKGGRCVSLASQVEKYPGGIDVFKINTDRFPDFDRAGSVAVMRRFRGCNYGWSGIAHAALLHLPGFRLLTRPVCDDRVFTKRPPFCSHAIALADRNGGGVDPVRRLADWLTEPCDLARSWLYWEFCNLVSL